MQLLRCQPYSMPQVFNVLCCKSCEWTYTLQVWSGCRYSPGRARPIGCWIRSIRRSIVNLLWRNASCNSGSDFHAVACSKGLLQGFTAQHLIQIRCRYVWRECVFIHCGIFRLDRWGQGQPQSHATRVAAAAAAAAAAAVALASV